MANFSRDRNRAGVACALALLVLSHPSRSVADALGDGRAALRRGWYATAFRLCHRAAAAARSTARRAAALVCQGRAALGLHWPQAALRVGHEALRARDDPPVRVLLGDAHRAVGDCRSARPHYLLALEQAPSHRQALVGLRACARERPPARALPPPLSGPRPDCYHKRERPQRSLPGGTIA